MSTDTTDAPSSLEEQLLALDPEQEAELNPPTDEAPPEAVPDEPEGDEEEEEDEPGGPLSFFDLAEREGLNLRDKYRSEEEAMRRAIAATRLVGQRNELAEWGRLIQERPEEVLQVLQQRLGKPTEAPKLEEAPAPTSDDPEVAAYLKLRKDEPPWDDDWENQITTNDKGQTVPTDDAEPGVMRKIAKRRSWERSVANYLIKNPAVVMKAAAADIAGPQQKEIAKLREELDGIRKTEQQRATEQFGMQVAVENREWMFHNGEVRKGNLTEYGQIFTQVFDRMMAENPGTRNPAGLIEAAKALTISISKQRQTGAKPPKTKKPAATEPADTEQEPEKPANMRAKLNGNTGRAPRVSASGAGRGPAGARPWPKVGGRDMTLAERLAQQMGKK